MALNVYALAAYTLHPIHSELASIKLSDSQQRMVQDFLISELGANALEELMQFQEKRGFFGKLYEKDIRSAVVFWNAARVHYRELSQLALKLHRIPAASAAIERVFSQWSFVHNQLRNRLSFDKSQKLLKIYYSLKMLDSNCLLYTSPSPRDRTRSRMPSSA